MSTQPNKVEVLEIATDILTNPKNKEFEQAILDNKNNNYALIADKLTGPVMGKLSAKYGGYVKKHDLVWALINVAEGTADEDELDI